MLWQEYTQKGHFAIAEPISQLLVLQPHSTNSVHDGSISCIGSTKWQYGLLQKSSNEEVSDKKAAKFSNPCRVLSQIQICKLSSRHFPHLIGFSLPSCWTFSQTLVVIMMMLKLNFCRLPQVLSHGENSATQGQCRCRGRKGYRKYQKGHNNMQQNSKQQGKKTTKFSP